MALADAQNLAVRKLLTRAAFDNTVSPGPPLPKSHPSPALAAKLHLECAALYSPARALVKTPASSSQPSKSKFKLGAGRSDSTNDEDVVPELRRYLADELSLHNALAHKWLGVDAGEAKGGAGARAGEAVAFLRWAKDELDALRRANVAELVNMPGNTSKEREAGAAREDALRQEVEALRRDSQRREQDAARQAAAAREDARRREEGLHAQYKRELARVWEEADRRDAAHLQRIAGLEVESQMLWETMEKAWDETDAVEEEAEQRPPSSFADKLRAEKNGEEAEDTEDNKPVITEQEGWSLVFSCISLCAHISPLIQSANWRGGR